MNQHPRLPGPGRRPAADRCTGRGAARLAVATAAVAAVAALLSGCGIRDTALPVDAGQGASRTACPPAPGVSLSQLDRDAYSPPAAVWAAPAVPAQVSPSASPSPSSSPSTAPTSTPNPDGTLSCLLPSTQQSVTPTAAPSGAPSP